MNSLSLISARVIGTTFAPPRPHTRRSHSISEGGLRSRERSPTITKQRSSSQHTQTTLSIDDLEKPATDVKLESNGQEDTDTPSVIDVPRPDTPAAENKEVDEKTPLLDRSSQVFPIESKRPNSRLYVLVRRIADAFTESVKWVLSQLLAPGAYIAACFYNEDGRFSASMPIKRMRRKGAPRNGSKSTTNAIGISAPGKNKATEDTTNQVSRSNKTRSTPSAMPPKVKVEHDEKRKEGSGSSGEESPPTRRSIRIKNNEEAAARRRSKEPRKKQAEEAVAAELKSPTSSASSLRLTKYPHAPVPPRPLIPRRQNSYSTYTAPPNSAQRKTLVLDLDETLIHSMAKGGRMSTGHMVEVKLAHPANYNGMHLGPQHPILYYVHKRPHCDEFLKKVGKWYNLVAFTASVQEYADPVIDWLEQERKYFSARYYRQHCTFRTGAYIKDLSMVEPDLSKVMILDNSPLSYIFHEDNAIPIEGWINDPTDNDLLHLIPLLEGLQYVTDVRAVLALRRGEVEATQ